MSNPAGPDTGQAREADGVSPSSGEPYGPGTVVDVIAEEINETVGMKVSWPRISAIAHRAAARLRREGHLSTSVSSVEIERVRKLTAEPSGDTAQARDVR